MKNFVFVMTVFFLITEISCTKQATPDVTSQQQTPIVYTPKEIYYYSYADIDGNTIKVSDFKGKKIMFVNTASYCGNTPQYDKLEALYKKYSSTFVIIGFPCNQFGAQEPGTDSTIKVFCTGIYHVTFPMASKIDVLGPNQHPIYKWLTSKSMNDTMDSQIAWNFQKYLLDEKGKFVAMFSNTMQPDDPSIIAAIEKK